MTSVSHAGGKNEVDVHPGLTYATHDGIALLGDLYVPKGAGPFPVLVALHGYALFAISYRLAKTGQKTFPQAVHDAMAAVQFVRGSAAEFKLDGDRVGLMGASAGANLAALAALGGDTVFKGGYPQ